MPITTIDKSLTPYTYLPTDENEFRFVTEAGNIYYIYLLEYWQQDVVRSFSSTDIKVYEFNFEVEKLVKVSLDSRIAITIFTIIDQYFILKDTAVYYVTQRLDGRSKQLFRLYQFWYKMYRQSGREISDKLVKLDRVVESYGEVDAYVSCMFHKERFSEAKNASLILEQVLLEVFPNSSVSDFNKQIK